MKQSAALCIWTWAWTFQAGIGKNKRLCGKQHNRLEICHLFLLFFFPKGNLGQISWVKLLKKKGWCDRELWGGHCHSHDQAHRPFPVFSWRLTSPVGIACLFKVTGLPGKGSNIGSQSHWLNIGEEIWSNSHYVPYRSRWDMNESAIHPCELPP